MLFRSAGVAKDAAKATTLFERACTMKFGDGCMAAAHQYLDAGGMPKDEKKAAELFQSGCDYDSPRACLGLANAYQNGKGIGVDKEQAKMLFERACKAGVKEGCNGGKKKAASGGACGNYGSWGMTCGGSCVNTYNNRNHCGNCGVACNGICDQGRCW